MADELPTEFDVIVVGTGMPESIVAAACSRIGQSVLHIDRNEYYSGQWASFNLEGIGKWKNQAETGNSLSHPTLDESSILQDGETLLQLPLVDSSYRGIDLKFHVSDTEPEGTVVATQSQQNVEQISEKDCKTQNETSVSCDDQKSEASTVECHSENVDTQSDPVACNKDEDITKQGEIESDNVQQIENQTEKDNQNSEEKACVQSSEEIPAGSDLCKEQQNNDEPKNKPMLPTWTKSKIKKEWRRFNLDLNPRMLYCGGKMVELLITSDIAKYCEFKTISRMLTILDGKLEQVPCSRADVFSSKKVSMLEKRMLMKFLTFCADFEKHPEDYQEFADKPFVDYMKHKKLTSNLLHFVEHSISMVTNQTSTLEGLKKTQKFLQSLGRYGNTAFLWPLYGSGEMPQSFCRMCAVFGGVYCLRMSASSLIINSENKCKGIITTDGKRISSKFVIMEQSYAPEKYFESTNHRFISRCVLLTSKSIMPTSDPHQLSLLRIPDPEGGIHPTTVLELPPSSMACPLNMHVIHLTRESQDSMVSAEENLQHAVKSLFTTTDEEDEDKPKILWSLYFQQRNTSHSISSTVKPDNVYILPGPGAEFDLDNTVIQAREIFEQLMPGEEFLPRPPNPEDIIYVDEEEASVSQTTNQSDFQQPDDKTETSENTEKCDSKSNTEETSSTTVNETDRNLQEQIQKPDGDEGSESDKVKNP